MRGKSIPSIDVRKTASLLPWQQSQWWGQISIQLKFLNEHRNHHNNVKDGINCSIKQRTLRSTIKCDHWQPHFEILNCSFVNYKLVGENSIGLLQDFFLKLVSNLSSGTINKNKQNHKIKIPNFFYHARIVYEPVDLLLYIAVSFK